jgi:hypothetical protein
MDHWRTVVITMEIIQSMSNSHSHAEPLSPTKYALAFFFTCNNNVRITLHGNSIGRKLAGSEAAKHTMQYLFQAASLQVLVH